MNNKIDWQLVNKSLNEDNKLSYARQILKQIKKTFKKPIDNNKCK